MNRIVTWLFGGACATVLAAGIAVAPAGAVDGDIMPINAVEEVEDSISKPALDATFIMEEDDRQERLDLWVGKSLIIAGNNITSSVDASTGLVLAAGNMLTLQDESEYGFVFGNVISFAGTTARDLFAAGNMITIESNAKIGRDVFVAGAEVVAKSDLAGDFSATAAIVTLKDITIAGNVNLEADEVHFEGNVEIAGTLTYNDNAEVFGRDEVSCDDIKTYHVEEVDTSDWIAAELTGKFYSIVALFLAMALICAIYPKTHQKVAAADNAGVVGKNLALGLALLIGIPAFMIFALFTIVAAPLSLVALALYLVMIYLSQGFAGLWVGHVIIEKLCKFKGNVYLEALLGIFIMGLLSFVPYLGVLSGLFGLLFGMGLILQFVKPVKGEAKDIAAAKPAKLAKTTQRKTK